MNKNEIQMVISERLNLEERDWFTRNQDTRYFNERRAEFFVCLSMGNYLEVFVGVRGIGYGTYIKIRTRKWSFRDIDEPQIDEIIEEYQRRLEAIENWCETFNRE